MIFLIINLLAIFWLIVYLETRISVNIHKEKEDISKVLHKSNYRFSILILIDICFCD
jgi:hypothetical protein